MIELEVIAGIDTPRRHPSCRRDRNRRSQARRRGIPNNLERLQGDRRVRPCPTDGASKHPLVRRWDHPAFEGFRSLCRRGDPSESASAAGCEEKPIRSTPTQPHQRLWPPTIIRNRNNSTVSSSPLHPRSASQCGQSTNCHSRSDQKSADHRTRADSGPVPKYRRHGVVPALACTRPASE